MSDLNTPPPSGGGYDGRPDREAVIDPAIDELDNEQVRRWAKLIVGGDEASIAHLSADNRDRIESDVRRQLRARLMRMIARTIAQDILAEHNHDGD